MVVPDELGQWCLTLARRLDHVDRSRSDGGNYASTITALCPLDHLVYTGDDKGRVVCLRSETASFHDLTKLLQFEWTYVR